MGRDKALVDLAGAPMIMHVADALEAAGLEIAVAGRPSSPVDAVHLADPPGTTGPAAGLLAALDHASGGDVVLVAADQPFARADSVARLATVETDSFAVPIAAGHLQVTFGLYRAACRAPLAELMAEGGSALRSLVAHVAGRIIEQEEWEAWGEDGSSWWSIDTPEDLAAARRRR
jgi:molybdenum cofactor guanylyltransferase